MRVRIVLVGVFLCPDSFQFNNRVICGHFFNYPNFFLNSNYSPPAVVITCPVVKVFRSDPSQ